MNKKTLTGALSTIFSVMTCAIGFFALATGCQGESGPQGEKGDIGVSITSVVKINMSGAEDTYEIRFSDGETTTFTIKNGVNGENGADGIGIRSATLNQNGELVLVLTDDREINLGKVTGEKGDQGIQGIQGIQGEKGDDAAHANEKHTVTYSPNGGELPDGAETCVTVDYGDTLNLPIPTRENYTFEGWYTGNSVNDGRFTTVTPVTKTITLTARWVANISYRLTYETNGGNALAPTTHYFDETLTTLPTPVKYDSSFVGWYQDESLTTPVGYPLTLTENTTLYAKWTTAYYYVNFHTNCDEVMDAQHISAGTSFDAFTAPENETFAFAGWYLDSGFSQAVEYPFVIHADTELFAKWNDVYYTFSFISNGGSQISAQQYRAGVGLDSLPTPTRTNYLFSGWYEDFELTTPVAFPYEVNGDKILYAKWVWVDPYADYTPIYDVSQFQQIRNLNGKYVLMNNLDFTNQQIKQIGSSTAPFTGVFDGQGYTITNLVLSGSGSYYGLFAVNNGTITNVKFENVSQSVTYSSKSYVSLLAAENNGTITKVSLNGNLQIYTDSNSTMKSYVGLITATNNGQINNCVVSGKVDISRHYSYNNVYVGTICSTNVGKVFNCFSSATILSSDGKDDNLHLGGVVSQNAGEIKGCVFIGSMCFAEEMGAISAITETGATEKQCYEYSNATGGTSIVISSLNSSSFYHNTLGWDTSIWNLSSLDYENGLYAKLY